jgi:hypothetical protein
LRGDVTPKCDGRPRKYSLARRGLDRRLSANNRIEVVFEYFQSAFCYYVLALTRCVTRNEFEMPPDLLLVYTPPRSK